MSKRLEWVQAFAVLRSLQAIDPDVDLNIQVKVVSVWPDEASATAEVARLSGLPSSRGQLYWWQSTHLYSRGRQEG